jgi:photosystem I subunit 9
MKKFLTTAPVFSAIWFAITAVIMIVFNRFVPDLLFFPR